MGGKKVISVIGAKWGLVGVGVDGGGRKVNSVIDERGNWKLRKK